MVDSVLTERYTSFTGTRSRLDVGNPSDSVRSDSLELVSKPCQARVLPAASPTGCSDEKHSNGRRPARPAAVTRYRF